MGSPQRGPAARDRLLRRVRVSRWATGLGAAGLTAAFSVAAAHAFKGHDGHAKAQPTRTTHARVAVPAPDKVPSIAADGSLQPPAQAPQATPQPDTQQPAPAPEQAPPVSGGS